MRRVTVVGLGALGSHLVQDCRNEDVAWRLIDMDRVEGKNVLAQFHVKQQVGKNKAQALTQVMLGFFGTKTEAIPHRLTSDNVDVLLGGSALIVDCVDDGPTRRLIQAYVRTHDIPCVHGALAPGGTYGLVQWDDHGFVADDAPSTGAATCQGGENLVFVTLTSACLAEIVHTFLEVGKKLDWSVSPGGARVI